MDLAPGQVLQLSPTRPDSDRAGPLSPGPIRLTPGSKSWKSFIGSYSSSDPTRKCCVTYAVFVTVFKNSNLGTDICGHRPAGDGVS